VLELKELEWQARYIWAGVEEASLYIPNSLHNLLQEEW
jgi:hypothetical protein